MPKFSKRSISNLAQANQDLQDVFNEVIEHYDCTVICGNRSLEDQKKAFEGGFSKAKPGESPHNYLPSLAVDVVPTVILKGEFIDKKGAKHILDWNSPDPEIQKLVREELLRFGGFVKGVAASLNVKLRWGGDFKSFEDLPHFELLDWETRKIKPNKL